METFDLDFFKGVFTLTGVGFSVERIQDYYDESNTMSFRMNGNIYTAMENPVDGYRSCLGYVKKGGVIDTEFPPCTVVSYYSDDDSEDILRFIDLNTGKTVLELGTNNTDNYYPWCVMEFHPDNMAVNSGALNDE
jgi:hypothetical protein